MSSWRTTTAWSSCRPRWRAEDTRDCDCARSERRRKAREACRRRPGPGHVQHARAAAEGRIEIHRLSTDCRRMSVEPSVPTASRASRRWRCVTCWPSCVDDYRAAVERSRWRSSRSAASMPPAASGTARRSTSSCSHADAIEQLAAAGRDRCGQVGSISPVRAWRWPCAPERRAPDVGNEAAVRDAVAARPQHRVFDRSER